MQVNRFYDIPDKQAECLVYCVHLELCLKPLCNSCYIQYYGEVEGEFRVRSWLEETLTQSIATYQVSQLLSLSISLDQDWHRGPV